LLARKEDVADAGLGESASRQHGACSAEIAWRGTGQAPSAFNQAQGRWRMIRKLKSGEYRLYSRKVDPKKGHRRNLGTFKTRAAAEKHERAVQFFKHG
jgi:hypothetical protein